MSLDIKRLVYDHSPIWWQNFMCTVAGHMRVRVRYDKLFEQRRRFFREAGRWSLDESEAYQLEKLQHLARHAYEQVGYYRRLFDQVKLKPQDIRKLSDWQKIPTLSKDDIRCAGEDLIASGYNIKKLAVSQSGGSTGMPMVCYHDRECLADVYASFWEYHRPGVKRSDPYATFQGMVLIPQSQKGGPYWRMNKAMNQRLYSIFHLSEETVSQYIEDINRFKPVYFAGYANSLYLLAKLAEEAGIVPQWAPKAVFSTSEQLLSSYKKTIERVFRTKVWDAYSQDEACGSISEYECGYYHYDRAYGYMEFKDKEAKGTRHVAEIICTGFLNDAWPLLRYRVGDLVEYEMVETCPKCGRSGPIIHEIRGRTGDVLITPSGRRFPHISLIVKNLRGVRQLQVLQKAREAITIRYVPAEDFQGNKDEKFIIESFQKAVNEPINWTAEKVSKIPRTQNGKFLSIINELDKSEPSG
jgi:phenylacetate-CoA ligase